MVEENEGAYVAEIERELCYVSSWKKQRGNITLQQFLALQSFLEAGDMTDR